MKSGTLAGSVLESCGSGDPSGMLSRTSFTMSAGDLKTKGGSCDRESLLKERLLLGGL